MFMYPMVTRYMESTEPSDPPNELTESRDKGEEEKDHGEAKVEDEMIIKDPQDNEVPDADSSDKLTENNSGKDEEEDLVDAKVEDEMTAEDPEDIEVPDAFIAGVTYLCGHMLCNIHRIRVLRIRCCDLLLLFGDCQETDGDKKTSLSLASGRIQGRFLGSTISKTAQIQDLMGSSRFWSGRSSHPVSGCHSKRRDKACPWLPWPRSDIEGLRDDTLDDSQNDPPDFQFCLVLPSTPPLPTLSLFPILQIMSRSPRLRKCTFAMEPLTVRGREVVHAALLDANPPSVERLFLFSSIYVPGEPPLMLPVRDHDANPLRRLTGAPLVDSVHSSLRVLSIHSVSLDPRLLDQFSGLSLTCTSCMSRASMIRMMISALGSLWVWAVAKVGRRWGLRTMGGPWEL